MTTNTTPARRRKVATTDAVIEVPAEARTLAVQFFTANRIMNAAKGKADKARASLLALMRDKGVLKFNHEAVLEDGKFVLDVERTREPFSYIDTATLRTLVPDDVFMRIVEASIKSTVEVTGQAIATQATRSALRDENVKVKPRK